MSHLDKEDLKQIERIVGKYSDKIKDKVLNDVAKRDHANSINGNMALGIGIMLAAPSFVDQQNGAHDWWRPVVIFLCGYVLLLYPGLLKFFKKLAGKKSNERY